MSERHFDSFGRNLAKDHICPVCFDETYCKTNCRHTLCLNCSAQLDFCPLCESDLDPNQMITEKYKNGNVKFISLKQPHMNILANYHRDGSLNQIVTNNDKNTILQVFYKGSNKVKTITTVVGMKTINEKEFTPHGCITSEVKTGLIDSIDTCRKMVFNSTGHQVGEYRYVDGMLQSTDGDWSKRYLTVEPDGSTNSTPGSPGVECFEWHYMGNLHNLDGPAVVKGHKKSYYIYGKKYSLLGYKMKKMFYYS